MSLKPPKYVDSVRYYIYWEYAQLIAKAAGFENNLVLADLPSAQPARRVPSEWNVVLAGLPSA